MDTFDDKIDFWFYTQTLELFHQTKEQLDTLIEWDKHRRVHLLGFRSDAAEAAFQSMVSSTYSTFHDIAVLIRESRGLIKVRWVTLLREVEIAEMKYKPLVELAISAF